MASWFAKMACCCVKKNANDDDDEDPLLWHRDLLKHSCGEFSFAVAQANEVMEDHSQVETGLNAILVGVYDGHGGPEASRFINRHFFDILLRIVEQNNSIDERILSDAFKVIEVDFGKLVESTYVIKPLIAAVGSSCLVGVIWKGTLYIGNVGDSRAVIGYTLPPIGRRLPRVNIRWTPPGAPDRIIAEQLTLEHNVKVDHIREELRNTHTPFAWDWTNGKWLIQGIIQVSKSIGDLYLKRQGYPVDLPGFTTPDPRDLPVLKAEPSLCSKLLQPKHKFIIFASAGLWEHITNKEAVEMVHKYPRIGIAKRLVKAAQKVAADKKDINKKDLEKIVKGTRREYHDDITVIVVFIDHELLGEKANDVPESSYKGFVNSAGESRFCSIQELM